MVVYLDGVIGLNFLVDWLLILGVNSLSGHPPGVARAAAGAMVGGGYAGACMLPGFGFLAGGLWKWLSLALITAAAFGFDRSAWSRGVLFVILSMALGGLVVSIDTGNFPGIVACGLALALLCRMGFRDGAGKRQLLPAQVFWNGKMAAFQLLLDTGNTLRDPMTGESVTVASARIANILTGLQPHQLRDPYATILAHPELPLRLIPYSAVGQERGMLLALRCRLKRNGEITDRLVAFAPCGFEGKEYQGLTGG